MKISIFLALFLVFFSCKEQPVRRPIEASASVTVYAARAMEREAIQQQEVSEVEYYIAQDTTVTYRKSLKGFWHTSCGVAKEEQPSLKNGDQIEVAFESKKLNHQVLAAKEALDTISFTLGKDTFIPVIENVIKLMKIGETRTFVLPSYLSLGILTDKYDIEKNKSIIITVTLINIK